jgi:hypothetical protein
MPTDGKRCKAIGGAALATGKANGPMMGSMIKKTRPVLMLSSLDGSQVAWYWVLKLSELISRL